MFKGMNETVEMKAAYLDKITNKRMNSQPQLNTLE